MAQTGDNHHADDEQADTVSEAPERDQLPSTSQKTNGMAVAALVLAVLWIGGLGSVVGAILGNIAATDCKRTGQPGEGIATAAVLLGGFGAVLTLFAYFS